MFLYLGFYVALVIQLIFILFIFSRLLTYQEEVSTEKEEEKPVSVIVCAHNEYKNLSRFLPGLLLQQHTTFEIIVVNDRSEDATQQYLNSLSLEYPRLKIITISHTPTGWNPKKHALHRGIRQAQHEIILLTDADCMPAGRHWIKKMQTKISAKTDVVLGFSPYIKEKGILNAFIQYETFLTAIQYMALALVGLPYMGVGRNLGYRKSLFINKKGLERYSHIVGGDDDLFVNGIAQKQNTTICLDKESYTWSVPKRTWKSWYYQKIRHLSVGKHYQWKHQVLLGSFVGSLGMCWGGFIVLGIIYQTGGVILGFLLRILVMEIIFCRINKKIQGQIHCFYIPVFDFLYTLYIFIFSLLAISRKKVQWE